MILSMLNGWEIMLVFAVALVLWSTRLFPKYGFDFELMIRENKKPLAVVMFICFIVFILWTLLMSWARSV